MLSELKHRALTGFDDLSSREFDIVLAGARTLQRARRAGTATSCLRGKNIALVVESADGVDARRFCRAARELGANVAHIRPSLSRLGNPQEVRHTAEILGRLYDAIACEGMSHDDVRRIRRDAGVPVYENAASDAHPTAGLADRLGGEDDPEDCRHYVLQAVLLTLA
jgi:ornithine carbamoyltransferase